LELLDLGPVLLESWNGAGVEAQKAFQSKELVAHVAIDQRIAEPLGRDGAPASLKRGDQGIDLPGEAGGDFFVCRAEKWCSRENPPLLDEAPAGFLVFGAGLGGQNPDA